VTDQELMQSIKAAQGELLASVAATCSVPAAFFAALIANESGGNADARRFEPLVLLALWKVLLGRTAAYGSISRTDLVSYISSVPAAVLYAYHVDNLPYDAFQRLDNLATSFGLVQIMGYEAIAFRSSVTALQSPASELGIACNMLADFARRNGLDVTEDFSELFDCWNTGRPHAQTADPKYIPNGLARMALYEALA
jgi:hypothetical protein